MNKEIKDIQVMHEYVQELDREAVELETKLKAVTERARYFREDVIPEFMFSLGISEVKLNNGQTIGIKTNYFGNISKEREQAAFKWLKENGFASLVETTVGMSFGAGDEDKVDHAILMNFLNDKEIEHVEKESVHAQTLKAFIRQEMEAGHSFPYGLFGVYVSKQVVVK